MELLCSFGIGIVLTFGIILFLISNPGVFGGLYWLIFGMFGFWGSLNRKEGGCFLINVIAFIIAAVLIYYGAHQIYVYWTCFHPSAANFALCNH